MTREEKIKKAVAIAVAYYIEQEKTALKAETSVKAGTGWNQAGKAIHMNMKRMIQHRGSIQKPRNLFKNEEPKVLI
ncbi:hypothetical protein [Roseimarinus sediminis]|jgi:hypothetical protein|uniref:hypothetical protein n=1 Tax=Roseimarinus sediminis TaxID=1610899 RepID=UPI003D1E18BC